MLTGGRYVSRMNFFYVVIARRSRDRPKIEARAFILISAQKFRAWLAHQESWISVSVVDRDNPFVPTPRDDQRSVSSQPPGLNRSMAHTGGPKFPHSPMALSSVPEALATLDDGDRATKFEGWTTPDLSPLNTLKPLAVITRSPSRRVRSCSRSAI